MLIFSSDAGLSNPLVVSQSVDRVDAVVFLADPSDGAVAALLSAGQLPLKPDGLSPQLVLQRGLVSRTRGLFDRGARSWEASNPNQSSTSLKTQQQCHTTMSAARLRLLASSVREDAPPPAFSRSRAAGCSFFGGLFFSCSWFRRRYYYLSCSHHIFSAVVRSYLTQTHHTPKTPKPPQQSKFDDKGKQYRSVLQAGTLTRDPSTKKFSSAMGEATDLFSGHNEAGRGMELSELINYRGCGVRFTCVWLVVVVVAAAADDDDDDDVAAVVVAAAAAAIVGSDDSLGRAGEGRREGER